jgi:beta-lactam-binding protein with PASTA domain
VKPACVTVPNVIGSSVSGARSALIGKGFKVSVIAGYSASANFFVVFRSNPGGGTCAARGSTVRITWNDPNKEP